MAQTRRESDPRGRARKAFEELEVEDKALFVLEAMTSTVLGGLAKMTDVISSAVDDIFDGPQRENGKPEEPKAPTKAKRKSSTAKKRTKKRSAQTRRKPTEE